MFLLPRWLAVDESYAGGARGGRSGSWSRPLRLLPRSEAGGRDLYRDRSTQTWAAEVQWPSWAGSRTRRYE